MNIHVLEVDYIACGLPIAATYKFVSDEKRENDIGILIGHLDHLYRLTWSQ